MHSQVLNQEFGASEIVTSDTEIKVALAACFNDGKQFPVSDVTRPTIMLDFQRELISMRESLVRLSAF